MIDNIWSQKSFDVKMVKISNATVFSRLKLSERLLHTSSITLFFFSTHLVSSVHSWLKCMIRKNYNRINFRFTGLDVDRGTADYKKAADYTLRCRRYLQKVDVRNHPDVKAVSTLFLTYTISLRTQGRIQKGEGLCDLKPPQKSVKHVKIYSRIFSSN